MFSFWQKEAFLAPADVLIGGAGFVGLWCAYELKMQQPNLKITVVEKEAFPGGASVRNAGFACFGSPGEMLADTAVMGAEKMWETVALRYKGIQKLRAVLGDAAIAYDACGGYECFRDDALFQTVNDQLSWLNDGMKNITGSEAAFTIADDKIAHLGLQNFRHLVVNRLEGSLHSGMALKTLLQKVISLGVTVLFGTEITHWENAVDGVNIRAAAGEAFTLKAGRLLIATNAFTPNLTPAFPVQPARGQILLTAPIAGLKLRGTFHYDEGFYYWRNAGNRILLGGGRNTDFKGENTTNLATSALVQEALETFLHRHFQVPGKIEIEQRWAGIMGFTQSKQPLIQQPATNVLAMVACNGMGVALAPAIAEEMAVRILS